MYEYVYEYGSEAKIVLLHVLVHSNLSKLDAFALFAIELPFHFLLPLRFAVGLDLRTE